MKNKLDLSTLTSKLNLNTTRFGRYAILAFLFYVALIYGFVGYKITSLSGVQPNDEAINSHYNPIKTSRVDPKVIKQLQTLSDRSVQVQSLFEQARNNPFEEKAR
jgi:hypothetical protein